MARFTEIAKIAATFRHDRSSERQQKARAFSARADDDAAGLGLLLLGVVAVADRRVAAGILARGLWGVHCVNGFNAWLIP